MSRRLYPGLMAVMIASIAAVPAAAQTSPSAYTSATRYNLSGQVTGTLQPDPDGAGALKYAAVRNSYDAAGRLVKVEAGELSAWQSEAVAPSAWTGFTISKTVDTTYDSQDRKVKESLSAGGTINAVTQYSYDSVGRLDCTAVRMNPAVYGSLPASACSHGTAGSNGPDRITRNIYDAAGQLVQLREGVGSSVEAAEATYSYTANGRKEYVLDANGNRAKFEYDGFDRLTKWTFPSTTRPSSYNDSTQANALATAGSLNTADYEQYGYDANGNRTSLRKRDGSTLTYSYDALNRMTLKVVPSRAGLTAAQTRDVYYDYDLRGLMTKARFDSLSGEGVTSTYSGFGELASASISMGGVTRTLGYTYDKDGKRLTVAHPDNQVFTYTRDGLDRIAGVYEGTSITAAAQLIQATFNSDGLVSGVKRSSGTNGFNATFGYDGLNRLTSLANDATGTANDLTIGQGYNPASQIISQTRSNDAYAWTGSVNVSRTYTTNGLNQYTAAGPAGFTYDPNGNLTSDGSTAFLYDIENRLVSASGAKTAGLTWDPMGRLWQVTGATTDTRFLYDGDELVAEYDSAGTMARRYVHSDNADDPVVQYDSASVGAATRTFLMPDERGSIVGLIYDNGTSRAINAYDEYGIPGSANQGRFQYTGQIWLPELGMYHYKARIYSPTLGRFLQTDPIGYDDQINLYAYVGNDPMNMADPTGMCETPTGSIICQPTNSSDHTYRNTLAAGGALTGAILGGIAGGATGGTTGAVAGVACGPGAPACSTAGAIGGATIGAAEGAALGGTAGGSAGALLGNIIDTGIAYYNKATGNGSSGDRQFNGRPGSNIAQNRQVADAARKEGLNRAQRGELRRAVEAESRKGGANLGYHDIRQIAREIKAGNY